MSIQLKLFFVFAVAASQGLIASAAETTRYACPRGQLPAMTLTVEQDNSAITVGSTTMMCTADVDSEGYRLFQDKSGYQKMRAIIKTEESVVLIKVDGTVDSHLDGYALYSKCREI